jgi:putative transposase
MNWAIHDRGYSQRRACGLVGINPRVYRYRPTRPDDADLRQRLRELAGERRRVGYRRLHLLLQREGVQIICSIIAVPSLPVPRHSVGCYAWQRS